MNNEEIQREAQLQQIKQWYDYQAEQVEQKFKDLNIDAIQEMKSKIRRKQTIQEKDQNMEILDRERSKIIDQMKQHVKDCEHPLCQSVNEIVLHYDLVNIRDIKDAKRDPVYFICRFGQCLGYVKTKCPVGSQINQRMLETHKLLKNSAQAYS